MQPSTEIKPELLRLRSVIMAAHGAAIDAATFDHVLAELANGALVTVACRRARASVAALNDYLSASPNSDRAAYYHALADGCIVNADWQQVELSRRIDGGFVRNSLAKVECQQLAALRREAVRWREKAHDQIKVNAGAIAMGGHDPAVRWLKHFNAKELAIADQKSL